MLFRRGHTGATAAACMRLLAAQFRPIRLSGPESRSGRLTPVRHKAVSSPIPRRVPYQPANDRVVPQHPSSPKKRRGMSWQTDRHQSGWRSARPELDTNVLLRSSDREHVALSPKTGGPFTSKLCEREGFVSEHVGHFIACIIGLVEKLFQDTRLLIFFELVEAPNTRRLAHVAVVADAHQVCSIAQLAHRQSWLCLLYTSPSPRDKRQSRMPSSA